MEQSDQFAKIQVVEILNYCLPHQHKNWEINKYYLEKFQDPSLKEKQQLFKLFQEKNGVEVKNLMMVLDQKGEWISEFIPIILPFIAKLALEVESIFSENEVIILQTEKREVNNLTRKQVACLLSNMFFLTLHPQKDHEGNLPETFDFKNWLTSIVDKKRNASNQQKLVCLLHYFWRVHKLLAKDDEFARQIITYQRLVNENQDLLTQLNKNSKQMCEIEVVEDKGIEMFEDFECIHCDFANKFLGGGVLRTGCVQEEIMFSVAPELIVGMLFCQRQRDSDAILITGAERFCKFTGYSDSFKFIGPHNPTNKTDEENRKQTHTLAINAISFKQNPKSQYHEDKIEREILKSYAGFQGSKFCKSTTVIPIISGNWGCGVFKGDPQLKLILQWLSASQLNRKLYYCSFKEKKLQDCNEVIEILKTKPINLVYELIIQYSQFDKEKQAKSLSVFEFIKENLK